jgi:hypothetical protein
MATKSIKMKNTSFRRPALSKKRLDFSPKGGQAKQKFSFPFLKNWGARPACLPAGI